MVKCSPRNGLDPIVLNVKLFFENSCNSSSSFFAPVSSSSSSSSFVVFSLNIFCLIYKFDTNNPILTPKGCDFCLFVCMWLCVKVIVLLVMILELPR